MIDEHSAQRDPGGPAGQQRIGSMLNELSGACEVVVDPDVLCSYRADQGAPGLLAAGMPCAVVRPRTTSEVQAAMRVAARHQVPVIPRGAGSGLSGGANAVDGCVVMALERMSRICELDERSLTAIVEPGLLNAELRAAARQQGLLYAPDPASAEFCTIGGNVATNAGGLCCVKYGVTRDAVLGLEVVLADGKAMTFGGRTLKDVAGYDLTGLFCGSEGTLGIVTQATLRLLPHPPTAHTLAASFPLLEAAGLAVGEICQRHRPSLLELMDNATIMAVESMQPMDLDLDAGAMLFARSDAGPAAGREEIEAMARICERAGASVVVTTDEEAEGRMLMAARRSAYPALERSGATLLDDVAVPLSAITALIGGVEAIARQAELQIAVFGHAGDGNMHPTIVYDAGDVDQVRRAQDAFDAILSLAVKLGGTVTGEHGVGLLKKASARAQLGPSLEPMQAIKRALDPRSLLNPGKVL